MLFIDLPLTVTPSLLVFIQYI